MIDMININRILVVIFMVLEESLFVLFILKGKKIRHQNFFVSNINWRKKKENVSVAIT
jgi:hypothetical protein